MTKKKRGKIDETFIRPSSEIMSKSLKIECSSCKAMRDLSGRCWRCGAELKEGGKSQLKKE